MRQRDTSEFVAQGLRRLGYTSSNLKGGMKAWGEHYAVRALVEDPDLAIYQVSRPARGCLSYIVASAGTAIVIDPLRHLHPCLDLARGASLTIEAVIDTHGHADHISGGVALAANTGASYYLHPCDAIHPIDVLGATFPYEFICEGQLFPVGQHELSSGRQWAHAKHALEHASFFSLRLGFFGDTYRHAGLPASQLRCSPVSVLRRVSSSPVRMPVSWLGSLARFFFLRSRSLWEFGVVPASPTEVC